MKLTFMFTRYSTIALSARITFCSWIHAPVTFWSVLVAHVVVEPLLPCVDGYVASTMPVGALTAEVWRTNWPDQSPSDAGFDLGSLDR